MYFGVHTPAKLCARGFIALLLSLSSPICEACVFSAMREVFSYRAMASEDAIKFTTFNILCKISFDPTLIHSQKRAVRFEFICTLLLRFAVFYFNFNIFMIVKNFGEHFFILFALFFCR